MSKRRDEFLNHHWTAYPEMPQRALRWGRVEQHFIGTLALTECVLLTESGPYEHNPSEVLIEGDLLAILPNKQIILLAPNLTNKKISDQLWSEHKNWQNFLSLVRDQFKQLSFTEVKTPTLVLCPGTEPSLEVFTTEFSLGSQKKLFYLPTSPELNLKKLLAEGAEKIFEIAPVFRNGEITPKHQPEFLMLEWYRAFAGLKHIKMDVLSLIDQLAQTLKVPPPHGQLTYTVPELFKTHCNFELKPDTSIAEFKQLAENLNIDVASAQTIDDYFYLIFMEAIEYKWSAEHVVFVEKYPPYQAALARIDSQGWAERFEVYWRGFELGNAFHELNNPNLQRKRSLEDLEKKKSAGLQTVPLDESFFQALDYGLPPSAGIAVGLERLYMALYQKKDIADINRIYKIWPVSN